MSRIKPLASVALRVNSRHKLMVYVWPTLKSMRLAAINKNRLSKKLVRHMVGYFHAPAIRITYRGRLTKKIVGEIHLTKGEFGAGVFAHELQHFLIWWCDVKKLDPMHKHWEVVPGLAGDITNQFWRWFYRKNNSCIRPEHGW
jgi:hypothetical protein